MTIPLGVSRCYKFVWTVFAVLLVAVPNLYSWEVKEISYQTDDGWTIRGDLYLPTHPPARAVPAVILLAEPEWTDRSIYDTYLGPDVADRGMIGLAIDFRGTGSSLGKKEFVDFSPKERDDLQLDIEGAIKFLEAQKNVDISRLGIVGAGLGCAYALSEAGINSNIQALVLISGSLNQKAREALAFRKEIPIFFVVGKDDKDSFKEMADAFSMSASDRDDFLVGTDHGPVMLTHMPGAKEQITRWLSQNLTGLGTETMVSYQSKDGWTLRGKLRMPDNASAASKVPGVVLVAGARHDQQTYHNLARALTQKGLAVLTFDFRGKGRSIDPQRWHFYTKPEDLPKGGGPVLEKVPLDIKAGVNFLASQPEVDSNRIGLLGSTLGCFYTLQAAAGDPRIKTLILLTCGGWKDPVVSQFLNTTDIPILVAAASNDTHWDPDHSPSGSFAEDNRRIYLSSKSKYSEFELYDRGGHGSEMAKVQPNLEPKIVRWFAEKLAMPKPPTH